MLENLKEVVAVWGKDEKEAGKWKDMGDIPFVEYMVQ